MGHPAPAPALCRLCLPRLHIAYRALPCPLAQRSPPPRPRQVLYRCSPNVVANVTALAANGTLGPFNEATNPQICLETLALTAPNTRPYETPPHAGFPFGPDPAWFALEVGGGWVRGGPSVARGAWRFGHALSSHGLS